MLAISLIIFGIVDLAPGDPTSQLPLNVPVKVRDRIRESLGLDDPFLVKYTKWLKLMVVNEPVNTINSIFGTCLGNCEDPDRILSWSCVKQSGKGGVSMVAGTRISKGSARVPRNTSRRFT